MYYETGPVVALGEGWTYIEDGWETVLEWLRDVEGGLVVGFK